MKSVKSYLSEMVPEASVIWLVSLCSLGSIIAVVFSCVCGCRKKAPKNELMGLAGMVKLTNPDENVSYNTTVPAVQLNSITLTSAELAQETLETNKRQSSGVATATRSLPDLPVESGQPPGSGDTLWENNDHNDTSSDLYATVEENKIDGRGSIRNDKKCLTGIITDNSYGSPSQTEDSLSPYARLKGEHPYDQLKQSEHPYAQVRANGVPAGIQNHADCDGSAISTSSQSSVLQDRVASPVAPPRTRKSLALSQNSLPGLDSCTIPAATAIAGGIPANQELPYMTPPLPTTTDTSTVVTSSVAPVVGPSTQPQHFSGDSQDSSKGYTSISVREPLSNIIGERIHARRQELVDSHYATVSDDSDEMYAAIEEPNQAVYTSGSETYAQIRPTRPVLATIEDSEHTTSSSNPISSLKNEHSRQASSSSAASSGVCPNSPKPEKRQANSPLPRPPDPSTSSSSGATGIDDMYAKVVKKRRSSQSISSIDHEIEEPASLGYETLHNSSEPCHDSLIPGYERVSRVGGSLEPNYEELKPQDSPLIDIELCYATVNKNSSLHPALQTEPDYASLSRKDTNSGYDPNYESVCTGSSSDPNYESLEQQDEPPYEKLQSTSDDTSPDYETVYKVDSELYSKVNKHSNTNC
ncbi:uncharacterized protein LOC142318480 [Lycorma delicatula]|uniref:uncharacterized protein LOC142318480 n=1 Tax=Lycorma delicatula TaxID=130591 RepID=UPI003F510E7E